MGKEAKRGPIFVNDGIKGFEEQNSDKILDGDLKEDLAKFHSKIRKTRNKRASKNKNGHR